MHGMSRRAFSKIMVANRGEIAIRVFRACTELGIRTLAIYAHADQLSIHRYKADEAFAVGGPDESVGPYLDQEAILAVALKHGVDAIHPGYGFLSENVEFARRCEAAGVVFIGPAPDALETFGDKTASRKLAIEADVPVVPGTDGPVASPEDVRGFADEHGFPIIVKPLSAGAVAGCASFATKKRSRTRSRGPEAKPRLRSGEATSIAKSSSSGRNTSKFRFWPTATGARSIFSSVIVPCSAVIKKSSRSRPLFPSATRFVKSSIKQRFGSWRRRAMRTRERWNF